MDKFSLYDILGLLLPGIIFTFLLSILNRVFNLIPFLNTLTTETEIKELSVFFSFSIIFGAVFYTINFYLVNKTKWYNYIFGIYEHVAKIYLKQGFLHALMNETLNKKAVEIYSKPIFFSKKDFSQLNDDDKKLYENLQDEYYDIIYYELEHFDKITYAKTFQSFYFFFRQLVTVFLSILVISLIIYLMKNIGGWEEWDTHNCFILKFCMLCLVFIGICRELAKWYRKEMVMKMYWAYFTLLNNQINQNN